MSKRAQVFSMIAIMMSILFILIFSSLTHVPLDRKVPIYKAEISRVDSFVKDFDRLVINAVDRAAFGSLAQFSLLQQKVSETNPSIYFDNFTDSFESCFEGITYDYNSGIPALDMPCDSSFTLGSEGYNFSFSKYLDDLFFLASTTYNVSISYDNIDVSLYQQSAYELSLDISMNVYFEKNDYSWNRFINITRNVPINGMSHPIISNRSIYYPPYFLGHNFRISRFEGNVTMVSDFISEGYYFIDNRSSSIIDLFEGNFPGSGGFPGDNPFGISSILPANESYAVRGNVYPPASITSSLEYDYLNQNVYAKPDLRRIESPSIPKDQQLTESYFTDMGFDTSSVPIYELP